jgi:uncharacterized protein
MRLLPNNQAFFDDFDKHTALIVSAANALGEMTQPGPTAAADLAKRIKELEEEADGIVHRVAVELRRTFITPLDRDDTHRLMSYLDDVLDYIENAAYRLTLYKLKVPNRHLTTLVQKVQRSAEVTRDAVAALRDKHQHDHALELCVEINKLENEADAALRAALAELFSDEIDPIKLMKWKEVFEILEEATDRCEDVANEIENMLLES